MSQPRLKKYLQTLKKPIDEEQSSDRNSKPLSHQIYGWVGDTGLSDLPDRMANRLRSGMEIFTLALGFQVWFLISNIVEVPTR